MGERMGGTYAGKNRRKASATSQEADDAHNRRRVAVDKAGSVSFEIAAYLGNAPPNNSSGGRQAAHIRAFKKYQQGNALEESFKVDYGSEHFGCMLSRRVVTHFGLLRDTSEEGYGSRRPISARGMS